MRKTLLCTAFTLASAMIATGTLHAQHAAAPPPRPDYTPAPERSGSLPLQQAVEPPPRPDDGGPSLEVTLKFIVDKLNNQGQVNYSIHHRDGSGDDSTVSYQIVRAEANPQSCMISFRAEQTMDQGTRYETSDSHSFRFDFRDIEKLDVADTNTDSYASRYVDIPTTYLLTLHAEKPAVDHEYQCLQGACKGIPPVQNKIKGAVLTFDSEDVANRVAKAMLHAVELCGGGNHDPF